MAQKIAGFISHRLHLLLLALLILASISCPTLAQNSSDRGTPSESKAGQSSVSTYDRDKIETVNLANGNFALALPLLTVGGRGAASFSIALSYNSKVWSAQHDVEQVASQVYQGVSNVDHYSAMYEKIADIEPYLQHLGGGWTMLLAPGIKAKIIGIDPVTSGCGTGRHDCGFKYVLTKMWITLPDGSQVELRDSATEGAPALTTASNGNHDATDRDRGQVWHSFDGSEVIFVRDVNDTTTDYPSNFLPSGWVLLPNGTHLRMDAGVCSKIIDSDGNYLTIAVATDGSATYTDELGRQSTVQTANGIATVTAKGYMGLSDRTMTINTGAIGDHLRADFQSLPRPFTTGDALHDWQGNYYPHMISDPHTDLFNDSEGIMAYGATAGDDVGARTAVTQLNLLDGRSFQFHYNQYGEVAEIIYPGGGISQVDYYGDVTSVCEVRAPFQMTLNRRVSQRRALTDGANVDATWVYNRGWTTLNNTNYPTVTVEAHQGGASGTLLASEKHFFYAVDADYRPCGGPYTGTNNEYWDNDKEFRTETQTGAGTEVAERNWAQRAPVVWANDPGSSVNAYVQQHGQDQPPNDPRVTSEDTILEDGKMKRVEYGYDDFNNITSIKEYDFGTDGSPGALLRETDRQYLGDSPNISLNGLCYTNLNPTDSTCGAGLAADPTTIIYQKHLLLNETVKDWKDGVGAQKAFSSFEYDNYASDANHAGIVINTGMIGYDGTRFSAFSATTQPRGNVTAVSHWAGDSNYITAYSQYDNAGNVVWTKDPKGYVSTISYTDNFGDGSNPEIRTGGANGATFAFPTLATNALQQQAKSQYSYTLGEVTGVKDPNGVIARTEYDSIGRPFRVTTALGLTEQAMTEMIYPTATSNVALVSKQLDATNWLASKTVMDGFDRAVTAYQAEDGQKADAANFTIQAQTVYDALGRVKQVSNPYRAGQGETPVYTTSAYDVGGRVISVTTPDGAQVTTSYFGNQTTVTDQASKQRSSVTDALGRLASVTEDPTTNGLNYQTSYIYDTLDNLTQVTQGGQTRTFVYDSLKRLTAATNPESGTISYHYDSDGNLTQKTDARGVQTTYAYDALNRVTTRSYSDGTPTVTYTYDTLTNGKGRLTSVSSSVSQTSYGQYDALGRVKQSTQTIDGQSYSLSYAYNLAGALTAETYPSGRVITTGYDAAGRINQINGQKTGEDNKTYASQFTYSAHGAVTQMQLGNGLWEHTIFNNRLQPQLIGLGTVQTLVNPQDINRFRVDYSYGGTNNNGNVLQQTISINPDAQGNYQTQMTQNYAYDALNRLQSMSETGGLSQTFAYDRYGNRIITAGFVQNTTQTPNTIQNQTTMADWYDPATNKLKTVNYDPAGNIIKDTAGTNPGNTFDYDAENKQIRYDGGSVSGGADYKYDGDGRRVKKVIGTGQATTIYVYDAMGQMVAEYATTTPTGNGGTSYFTADHLGTPRVITGSSGEVKARHDYLPFGEEVSAGVGGRTQAQGYAVDNVRQKFTGQQRDDETGLDYFIHRYYNSGQGRFTSPDPTLLSVHAFNPQSWNRYEYVLNNPLMYVDPLGLWELYYKDVTKKKKNKDGSETEVFDHRQLYARKSKDGDNGATLAKQLGLRGKDAEKFASKIGDGNNIRLAGQGGDVGRVFKAAEDGLTRQVKWDIENHKEAGPGPQDCSYTACSIGFPNNDALRGQLTFSVQQADALITGDPGASSVQESDLRLGDIVRWANASNVPTHFATFIFRDDTDHPIVFSKSGEHGPFEYTTTTDPRFSGYGTIRGINSGDTGYYHPH